MARIITIIVLLFVSPVLAQPPDGQDLTPEQLSDQPAGASQDYTDNQSQPAPSVVGENTNADQGTAEESDRESDSQTEIEANRLAAQDLTQQTRMADGTVTIAEDTSSQTFYALWGIWINVIGLGILLVALTYNIKATNAATRSADAAMIKLRQDRAYMTASDFTVNTIFDNLDTDNPKVLHAHFIFRWLGKTKAMSI